MKKFSQSVRLSAHVEKGVTCYINGQACTAPLTEVAKALKAALHLK